MSDTRRRYFPGLQLMFVLSTVTFVSGQIATIPETPSHKFFDRQNVTAFAALASLSAIDGVHTQVALRSGRFVEGDPLARPFVARGWSGQLAGSALGYGTALSLTYLLHRARHHKMERWAAWFIVGAEAVNDTRNLLLKPPPVKP